MNDCKDPIDGIVRYDSFIVITIHLVDDEENAGRLLFKVTTDYGACFVLKKKHAMEFVSILKKYSKKYECTVFYQVYAKDERVSRIVKNDAISSTLEEMISQNDTPQNSDVQEETNTRAPTPQQEPQLAGQPTQEENGIANVVGEKTSSNSPVTFIVRFKRYMNRRRMKKLIRPQIGIAIGKEAGGTKSSSNTSRGRLLFLPFQLIRKLLSRNNKENGKSSA
jgi:hypothetical protein